MESGCANTEEVYETLNIQNPRPLQEHLNEYETVAKDLFQSARNLFDECTLSICPKRMNNELVISKRITKRF
jgi:shikimate kinase